MDVLVLRMAFIWRRYQGRVASVPVEDPLRDAIRLPLRLLRVGLPEGILPELVPQLGAGDVIEALVVLVRGDYGLPIIHHVGHRGL